MDQKSQNNLFDYLFVYETSMNTKMDVKTNPATLYKRKYKKILKSPFECKKAHH